MTARQAAMAVLQANDRGGWTRPAAGLYPHQWLWDSCFIAIGLRHTDPERAAAELNSLLRGQWTNGMLPHMIYGPGARPEELVMWQGADAGLAPRDLATSAITQPPMLAIAAELVSEKLPEGRRRQFLSGMVPAIARFHQWLYRERQPDGDGLIALVHPWESGLDNSPYWMHPLEVLSADSAVVNWLRSDLQFAPAEEREKPDEAIRLLMLGYELKRQHHRPAAALQNSPVLVGDLVFNAILAAANQALLRLATAADISLDDGLKAWMAKTPAAVQRLRDPATGQYFSYDFRQRSLIRHPTVATFTALLAEATPAQPLLKLLNGPDYALPFPVPSVPQSSPDFDEDRYWQGPVWINMNWLIIRGLSQLGQAAAADRLRQATLRLIEKSGCREYFSPLNGRGLGGRDFSWTAALYLDLLEQEKTRDQSISR